MQRYRDEPISDRMAELFLHIGLPKTGTTTIQQTFFENRKALSENFGIYYPGFAPNHGTNFYSIFCERPHKYGVNVAKGRATPEEVREFNSAKFEKIRRHLKKNTCRKLVISGERLSALHADGIARLRKFLGEFSEKQRVIVYVREPVGLATSLTQQLLKTSNTLESLMADPPTTHYRKSIERFISEFGRANVDIRIFDEAIQQPHGLMGDFMAALGESPELAGKIEEKRSNASMSMEAALILSAVQHNREFLPGKPLNIGFARKFVQLLMDIPGSRFMLPAKLAEVCRKRAADDIRWLEKQLGRNPFRNGAASATEARPEWSNETLRRLGLEIYGLYEENRKLKAKAAYQSGKRAAKSGKNRKALRFFKQATKTFPGLEQARKAITKLQQKEKRGSGKGAETDSEE